MIKIIQSSKGNASVIAIYSLKNKIFFIDCEGNFYFINKISFNKKSKPIIPNTFEPLHKFQKGASFSKNGHVSYSVHHDQSCAVCIKLSSINLNQQIDNTLPIAYPEFFSQESIHFYGNDQRAEVVSFYGREGEYFFTGGNDGRVYMYNTQSGKKLMSLKPKPEYISSLSVSNQDDALLAYGAFDKSLIILNFRYQKEELNTYLSDVIEHSFFYDNSKSFYAIGRDGNSYTYNIQTKSLSKKALFSSWPTCCILDASERFAIVGSRSYMMYIVKLSDNSQVASFKLDQTGVSSLHVQENTLFIGFENGYIYLVDMFAHIEDFSQALSIKNFKTAKKYLDRNIFLTIHPISEMFEEAWQEVIQQIINQFSMGNSALALEAAEPFLFDEKYEQEFASLAKKQKEFEKFALLVQTKEFFNAYGMLEISSYLANTDSARKLEIYFLKYFSEAKKIIALNPIRNITKAQELLKSFILVPAKKEMINSLFKNYEIYLKADLLVKERLFKEYFVLCSKYNFLKQEDVYKKVCNLAESSISKIKNMINQKKYNEALHGIKQILIFLPYKEQITNMIKEIQLKQKFSTLIESGSTEEIYAFVVSHPTLEETHEFIEFDKKFDDAVIKAMTAVEIGDIKRVNAYFLPYKNIPIFKLKIKECLRQASFNKLAIFFEKNYLNEVKIIAAYYLKEFGKDVEYEELLKKYEFAL